MYLAGGPLNIHIRIYNMRQKNKFEAIFMTSSQQVKKITVNGSFGNVRTLKQLATNKLRLYSFSTKL